MHLSTNHLFSPLFQDNCPDKPSFNQADFDNDGVGDICDNCPRARNPGQENRDGDETGDRCDPDDDNDFTRKLRQYYFVPEYFLPLTYQLYHML